MTLRHAAFALLVLAGWTASAAHATDVPAAGKAPESAGPARLTLAESPPAFTPRWFWFIGTSNYHVRLEESEREIDQRINGMFKLLLPGWEAPDTFKDWSDNWQIWDAWVGIGRELNEHVSITFYAGGGAGTVKNSETYYPFLIPVNTKVDFTRRSMFVGSSLRWYPFGRPVYQGKGLGNILRGGRFLTEMNVGYTHQYSEASVRLSVPVLGEVLHIPDKQTYDLILFSPRIGVEFPLSDRDFFNIVGGYTWMHQHGAEFNQTLIQFFYVRRF